MKKLEELVKSMTKLEEEIEQLQNTLAFSAGIPNDAKGQVAKKLEYKLKMFTLCTERLEGITNLINSNNI